MSTCRKLLAGVVLGASMLLAGPVVSSAAPAQDASGPSSIEREYWASTQQIGTESAYRAYLGKFPSGFYAALAAAALQKSAAAQPDGPPQGKSRPVDGGPGKSASGNPDFDARKIAAATGSHAITQKTGDVFNGPGPITVGWLGAKKQVLVPAGRWVLLGAEDGMSNHPTPVPVTNLILGRLEDGPFRSFLVARFNSKTGQTTAWADAWACKDSRATDAFAWHQTRWTIAQCVTSTLNPAGSTTSLFSSSLWKGALHALATAGGTPPGGGYLVTDMFFTGDSSNYLKVSRIDFGVSQEGERSATDSQAHASSVDYSIAGRRKWAETYAPLAARGYTKSLGEQDLRAGGGTPQVASSALTD